MFEAINGQGGMVNQMLGDGIMALFGAPILLENSAESAVRAALEMIELVELFNQQQAALSRAQIHIGIGIATGQVIAGYTGTMQRATYTCVGDAVNLAARLENYTKTVGEPILVDEGTCQTLSEGIRVIACGPVELKGKSQPVEVFIVPVGQVVSR